MRTNRFAIRILLKRGRGAVSGAVEEELVATVAKPRRPREVDLRGTTERDEADAAEGRRQSLSNPTDTRLRRTDNPSTAPRRVRRPPHPIPSTSRWKWGRNEAVVLRRCAHCGGAERECGVCLSDSTHVLEGRSGRREEEVRRRGKESEREAVWGRRRERERVRSPRGSGEDA